MRGGISMEKQAFFVRRNNPYLEDYNPDQETSYIMYFDSNNLYGWAMSQPLPVGGFHWCRVFPTKHQIMKWRSNRKIGYILEVDLEYPEELHEKAQTHTPSHKKEA